MKLLPNDLITYCKAMNTKTNWKFSITPVKDDYWYWKLELINNSTNEVDILWWWMNLREAHDFMRAFYRWLEYYDKVFTY
jgi:hypothetical protein